VHRRCSSGTSHVFDAALPVANGLVPFAVARLAARQSTTQDDCVLTSTDPFTEPQIPVAEKIIKAAGIKTVYYKTFPPRLRTTHPS